MNMADMILDKIDEKKNATVMGLDPRFESIPRFITEPIKKQHTGLRAVACSYLEFNKRIIDLASGIIGIVKPQSAFYEQAGIEGIKALIETINYAKSKGMIVIVDGKRNDIGTTAQAYSGGYLAENSISGISERAFNADLLTVTPYLGSDGIKPFIEDCKKSNKGIFVLVKTSNRSSGELQDLMAGGKKVYEIVAENVAELGKGLEGERGYSPVGAVVGATYPKEAEVLRRIMPKNIFLVPGFGAQGGTAKDILPCFNKDGYGAIINSSRGLIFPYKDDSVSESEFEKAIIGAATKMKNEITAALKEKGICPW
ncbi:orotidine-5'-phosphate decarboxylase [Candidatus Woesearchaeota archaeon]|nr:orotidine-5'-phosphate decarboxylase [Candidatus Woesearchaeota archaeon]